MAGASVLWVETPDDEQDETPNAEAHVDESFAVRRLRRWLKGMFGGAPAAKRPVRDSGPVEGAPGEPGGPPGERDDLSH
jgi:hypothetical protein